MNTVSTKKIRCICMCQSIDNEHEQKTVSKNVHMPNKTLVPGALQGYLLQVKHMLYEIICVDNRVVSVEALDDVAVQVDNKVVAEQLKSVTSANNPLDNRSPVFWKTLYNWCTYIEEGSLPHDAILRFIVVSSSTITPGEIQKSFENANTDEDSQKALQKAKDIILGATQANEVADAFADLPKSYRDYVKYLFDDSRKKVVCEIIKCHGN